MSLLSFCYRYALAYLYLLSSQQYVVKQKNKVLLRNCILLSFGYNRGPDFWTGPWRECGRVEVVLEDCADPAQAVLCVHSCMLAEQLA